MLFDRKGGTPFSPPFSPSFSVLFSVLFSERFSGGRCAVSAHEPPRIGRAPGWSGDDGSGGRPVVGVCAAGILIRAVAPLLADKTTEPPVVAVAEPPRPDERVPSTRFRSTKRTPDRPNASTIFKSQFSRVGQPERRKAAQAHFSPPPVNGHTLHPLRPAIVTLHQPKPGPVTVFARRGGFQKLRRKPVSCPHFISP